mmetsp:Transcript_7844/g.12075  ORF Transcript_7844/g.12075 Transcript_7844/m.12075 type:complete len:98 (-) Transcript_7844:153-446(-)
MAKRLEGHLYRSAVTKQEYLDPNTLKKRLQMIAHGLGVHRSGDGSSKKQGSETDTESKGKGNAEFLWLGILVGATLAVGGVLLLFCSTLIVSLQNKG